MRAHADFDYVYIYMVRFSFVCVVFVFIISGDSAVKIMLNSGWQRGESLGATAIPLHAMPLSTFAERVGEMFKTCFQLVVGWYFCWFYEQC